MKQKQIVVASSEKTNHPNEYRKTCYKCKAMVYLNEAENRDIGRFICVECFKKIDFPHKMLIRDNTVEALNKEFGLSFTKEDLKNLMTAIKDGKKDVASRILFEKHMEKFIREESKKNIGG